MKSVFPLLLLCSLAYGADCPTGQRKDPAALVQIEQVWLRWDAFWQMNSKRLTLMAH